MNTNRPWTVLSRPAGGGKISSSGWPTEKDALEFLAISVDQGDSIHSIKRNGKLISATEVFTLLRNAGIKLGVGK